MPLFGLFFLFFSIANIGLPGTASFIGEFLILVGIIKTNTFVAAFSGLGMVLGGAYSLFLANRILFGNINLQAITVSPDLSHREFAIFLPLVFCVLLFGLFPNILLSFMHTSCLNFI